MRKTLPLLKSLVAIAIVLTFSVDFGWSQCNDPSNRQVSGVGSTTAFISWNPVSGATSYRFGIKVKGMSNFSTVIETSNTFYNLTGLLTGTTYEWGVRALCTGESSNLPFGPEFTTSGPVSCADPENLTAMVTSDTEVSLDWDDATGATEYTVAYRKRNEFVGWEVVTTSVSSEFNLSGLQSGTTYLWAIRTRCTDISAQSELIFGPEFITTGTIRCEDPTGLMVTNVTDNSADIAWNAANGVEEYRVAYRKQGQEVFTNFFEVPSGTTNTTITGLTIATTYEWAIRTLCPAEGTVSERIFGSDFTTTGACDDPSNLIVSNITDTEARFDWDVANGANSYRVAYRVAGNSGWDAITNTTDNFLDVTGLAPGTDYEWAIRSICDGGAESNLIFGTQFTTSGSSTCEDPANLQAIVLDDNSAQLLWDIAGGSTDYRVAYRREAVGGPWEFITTTGGLNTYTATGLEEGTAYEWAVRNICDDIGVESNLILGPEFTTTGGSQVCDDPTNLNVANISDNGADLSWDVANGATSYRVAYKVQGRTKWDVILVVASNSLNLGTLQSGTTYEWAVRSLCPNELESNLVAGPNFTTTGAGVSCDDPTNHAVSGITTTEATLQWDAVAGANSYRVAYRVSGTPLPWDVITTVGTNSFNAMGLTSGTTYTWAVIATCNSTESGLISGPDFSTSGPENKEFNLAFARTANPANPWSSEVEAVVYPNPAEGIVNIRIQGNKNYNLLIYDVLGNLLLSKRSNEHRPIVTLDMSSYRRGVYLLKATINQQIVTQSFILK